MAPLIEQKIRKFITHLHKISYASAIDATNHNASLLAPPLNIEQQTSTMRISAILPLLFSIGSFLLVQAGDLDPTVSTRNIPEDLALCTDDSLNCTGLNRFCVENATSGDEFCGPCTNGTIENFTAPDDVEYPNCIFIDNITIQDFVAAFGDAIELGNIVDIAERLIIIRAVALFVSAYNAQFPNFQVFLLHSTTPRFVLRTAFNKIYSRYFFSSNSML